MVNVQHSIYSIMRLKVGVAIYYMSLMQMQHAMNLKKGDNWTKWEVKICSTILSWRLAGFIRGIAWEEVYMQIS